MGCLAAWLPGFLAAWLPAWSALGEKPKMVSTNTGGLVNTLHFLFDPSWLAELG